MKYFNKETLNVITKTLNEEYLDPYLVKYHKNFYELFNCCDIELNEVLLKNIAGSFQYISRESNYKIAKKYFKHLSNKYSFKLYNDIKRNKIEYFDKQVGNFEMVVGGKYYKIYVTQYNTLMDSFVLVHEYTHRLVANCPKKRYFTSSHEIYAEMLCILSELKYFDFLNEQSILPSDILITKELRKQSFKEEISSFLFLEPILSSYLEIGHLSPTVMNNLLGRPYYENYINVYNQLENLKNKPENIIKYLDYTHPFGTIFASFLHKKGISNNDFVKLINQVNKVELNEFSKMLPDVTYNDLIDKTKEEFSLKKIKLPRRY